MIKYVIKRLLLFIPILLGISFIALIFIDIAPGDPVAIITGWDAKPEEIAKVAAELKLDRPILVRYFEFVMNAVKGDLGVTFYTKRPVMPDILARFPYTALLASMSVILSILIGVPLGIYAATHQYSWKDNVAILISLVLVSMPSFWLALLLVRLLAVKLNLVAVSGIQHWSSWVLPTFSIAAGYAASISRQARSNMLQVIREDYITTARAKGQSEGVILYRHALKNACIPLVMTIGSLFGMALGGSLVTEIIFSIPGLGQYMIKSLTNRDYPAIQGTVLFMSVIFCIVILVIDIAFAFIDPRIRSQYLRKKMKAGEVI
ncbi:MAG: ABC transporter permease [Oscillospiraceae bacterium]|nr:ABC transporter permease [Oscillospiraceae bacterium]